MDVVLALLALYVFVLGLRRFYEQCHSVLSWVRDRVRS